VALYRNDLFKEAIPALKKSLAASHGESNAFDLFFLAMCHHRLGHAVNGQECYDRALKWMKERRDRLSTEWPTELTEIQSQAEDLLFQRDPR
jgi:hypothetical protein